MDITKHSILIIDRRRLSLDATASAVAANPSFNVAGKLTNAALAEGFLADNGNIDLILSDTRILNFIAPIKKAYPQIKIVVSGRTPDAASAKFAEAAGANTFIYKSVSPDNLRYFIAITLLGYNSFPQREAIAP